MAAPSRPDRLGARRLLGILVMDRPAERYYPALQGLRGLSAFSVFLVHIYRMSMNGGFLPTLPTFAHAGWSTLGTGVGLFFMISGFVIPGSLARHNDLRRFLLDRVLRIMPLFVIIHMIVFSVGLAVGYKWLAYISFSRYVELFASNLTFTALPLGLPLLQQNSWSLTYEWAFYLSLAALWALRMSLGLRVVANVVLSLSAAIACALFPMCLYFVAGACLCRVRLRCAEPYRGDGLVALACLLIYFGLAQFSTVALAVVPASILFLLCLQEGSATNRLFSRPILMWLGKVSFSLYLLHPLLMFPLQSLLGRLAQHGVSKTLLLSAFAITSTALVLPASLFSYKIVEVRLRAILHRYVTRDDGSPRLTGFVGTTRGLRPRAGRSQDERHARSRAA